MRGFIEDLITRWNTDEGRPYKGSLIDTDAYEHDPDNIGFVRVEAAE
jgi:hypothetical protein